MFTVSSGLMNRQRGEVKLTRKAVTAAVPLEYSVGDLNWGFQLRS